MHNFSHLPASFGCSATAIKKSVKQLPVSETSCGRRFTGLTLSHSGHGHYISTGNLEKGVPKLKDERWEGTWWKTGSETEADTARVKWGVRDHWKENVLAVTQLDHYLLLHKCDVVGKVKLIVWKWGEGAGLILNHYHRCTTVDSSSRIQGVLPWCSLEQIDKLVLHLQREECGMKWLKTHCPLCNCPLSAQTQQEGALFLSVSLIYWRCSVNTTCECITDLFAFVSNFCSAKFRLHNSSDFISCVFKWCHVNAEQQWLSATV